MERKTSAVVIGGGVGGLAAAAAALRHFDRVTVLDRDDLSGRVAGESIAETKKRRSGVPQYTEPHVLLAGGADALDALAPGFRATLELRGARRYDPGLGFALYDFGGAFVRGVPTGLAVLGASRRLVNETLQDAVAELGGSRLTLRGGTKVAGLLWAAADSCKAVRGVVLEGGEEVEADVVLVAGGRRAALPAWLRAGPGGGVALPPPAKVDCKMNYAARWMRLPPGFDPGVEFYAAVTNGRPALARGGLAIVVEDGMAQFSLTGFEGERAPLDEAGWMAYARSLPDPAIADLAARCEPAGPITRFASAPNASPQYHKAKLPEGLGVLGDAASALNPVYGQGMTVAALGAAELDALLAGALRGRYEGGARAAAARRCLRALPRRLRRRAAVAWDMSTSEDMRWPSVVVENVPRPPKMMYRYMDGVLLACQTDAKVLSTLLRVAQLVDPPSCLFRPRVLAKTLRQMVRGKKAVWGEKKGGEGAVPALEGPVDLAAVSAEPPSPSASVESVVSEAGEEGAAEAAAGAPLPTPRPALAAAC